MMVRGFVAGVAMVVMGSGVAFAQDGGAQEEAKPATFDAAEAKICTGVEKREAVGVKSSFQTCEKAYLWMKLRPNATKTESPRMKIRWSLNDKPYWTMNETAVRWGRSWYYKTVDEAGNWKAELLDENDTVVKSVEFTASGDKCERPKDVSAAGNSAKTDKNE